MDEGRTVGSMGGLSRWIPRLILGTAVLHCCYALIQENTWAEIVRDGFVGSLINLPEADFWRREASLWFLVSGIALLAMGTLAGRLVRATGRVPVQVGWYLLVIGLPMSLLFAPAANGGWLLVVIGVLALVAAYRHPVAETGSGSAGIDPVPSARGMG